MADLADAQGEAYEDGREGDFEYGEPSVSPSTNCPFLGLHGDRATRALYATPLHRCYVQKPKSVELDHQVNFCLGTSYAECVRFSPETSDEPARKAPSRRRVLVVLAPTALAVGAGLVFVSLTAGPGASSKPQDRTTSATSAPATQPSLPTQDVPAGDAAATLTPASPAPPTPTSPPPATGLQRTHVVQPGETLFGIALFYGTETSVLLELNDLSSTLIFSGQILTLPEPEAVDAPVQ